MKRRTFIREIVLLSAAPLLWLPRKSKAQPGWSPTELAGLSRESSGGGGTSYLLSQDCEGTSTPSGWTNLSGSPNWDYTSTVLAGSQSLRLAAGAQVYYTVAGQTMLEQYSLLRVESLPGSETTLGGIRDSSATALAVARMMSDGTVTVFAQGASSSPTVAAMAANTTYHIWVSFTSGGSASVAFSTDGTRPTTGDNYQYKAAASATAARVTFGSGTTSINIIVDKIRGNNSTIGSNPD